MRAAKPPKIVAEQSGPSAEELAAGEPIAPGGPAMRVGQIIDRLNRLHDAGMSYYVPVVTLD